MKKTLLHVYLLILLAQFSTLAQGKHDSLIVKDLYRFIQYDYHTTMDSSLLVSAQIDSICTRNLRTVNLSDAEVDYYTEHQVPSRFKIAKCFIALGSFDESRHLLRNCLDIIHSHETFRSKDAWNNYILIEFGNSFFAETNYDSALYYFKKVDIHAIDFDPIGQAKYYEKLAHLHNMGVEYAEALECLNRARELFRSKNVGMREANALHGISALYMMLDDYESAKYYALESLKILNSLGPESQIGVTQQILGKIYTHEEDYHKALEMYYEALNIFKAMNNSSFVASTLREIAHLHALRDECDFAIKRLDEAISNIDTSNFDGANVALVIDVGNSYLQAKDTAKAIAYLRLGVNTALEHGRNQPAMVGSMSLYRVHKTQGNIDKALEYLEYHTFLVKKSYNIETGTKFIENRVAHKHQQQSKSDWKRYKADLDEGTENQVRLLYILMTITVLALLAISAIGYRLVQTRLKYQQLEAQLEEFGFESNIGLSERHKAAILAYIKENEIDFKLTKEYEEQISYILRHPRAEQNEIAKKLNVSVDAIKKRFTKMYDRFHIDSNGSGGKRANLLSLLINILNDTEVPSI